MVFTASDEVQPQAVAYSNVPAGFSINPPLVFYQTSGGAEILLDQNGPTGQYLAIPAGAVPSGDTYFFVAGADAASASNGAAYPFVGIERYTATGGAQSFSFPTSWSYAGPTAASLPTFNLAYSSFFGQSDVTDIANMTWYPATGAIN